MIIPLHVVEEGVFVSTRLTAARVTGMVNFYIDTGTAVSFIGGIDARRLGISLKRLKYTSELWWGNSRFRLAKLRDVSLWFRTSEDRLRVIRLPHLCVSPDSIHTKEGDEAPNLLELDFMRRNNIIFQFDGRADQAHFELPEKG